MKTKLRAWLTENSPILFAYCCGIGFGEFLVYERHAFEGCAFSVSTIAVLAALRYWTRNVKDETPNLRRRNAPKRRGRRELFTEAQAEAYSALRNLGYHASMARMSVSFPGDEKRDLDELLRNALAAMRDLDAPPGFCMMRPC